MLSRRLLRLKAVKNLYSHLKSNATDLAASEKTLQHSIDKAYDLYYQMMLLIVDVADYAESRIELAKQKHLATYEDLNPNTRFIDNRLIAQWRASSRINDFAAKRGLGWAQYPELIKTLYNNLVASDYYKAYMTAEKATYRDDVRLVEQFYTREIENLEMVEEVLDEQSILWNDDLGFALVMVIRTLSNCRASQTEVPVLPKFKNDDDREFIEELFRRTLVNYDSYMKIVERFTRNWDVERIAFMDNLIMVTAISEMINFESIPVKVTLDEYIEIAKHYSSIGSGTFINGILDKCAEALTAEGVVVKSGRGLI